MPSFFIATLFSALTLTAAHAAPRAELAVAVQPAKVAPGDIVKASLVRPQPTAAAAHAAESPAKKMSTAPAHADEAPRKVSMEMVLAAVALMIVIGLRRLHSGPR